MVTAANYLIPKGLAVVSTSSSQQNLAKENAEETARQKALKEEAEKLAVRLEHLEC
jgi:ribosomal protein L9